MNIIGKHIEETYGRYASCVTLTRIISLMYLEFHSFPLQEKLSLYDTDFVKKKTLSLYTCQAESALYFLFSFFTVDVVLLLMTQVEHTQRRIQNN